MFTYYNQGLIYEYECNNPAGYRTLLTNFFFLTPQHIYIYTCIMTAFFFCATAVCYSGETIQFQMPVQGHLCLLNIYRALLVYTATMLSGSYLHFL